ncbi:serine hydrolase [Micromonospora sp. NBC_01813]|uniref:serine hydrolase n=1 Tax=Micromonospora sp. NBC_01813 TaxID=2975988 RepID=UPI002DD84846|nr:serine hydrolase [Micromonospora sp. NBC_01813]WSA11884.1 serine hydrolase [Micromonospora sp. NBC_01813]
MRTTTRGLLAALVAALTALAMAGTAATPATAHPGPPSPAFDPSEVDWASLQNMSEADFDAAVDTYRNSGFMVIDIDADGTANGARLAPVFQYNLDKRDWRVRHSMTQAEFDAEFIRASEDGMRIVDFETYVVGSGDRRFYAAVWVENKEGYGSSMRYGLTLAQFDAYYEEQRKRRLPIDVDMYPISGGVRFALIWVDNAESLDWALHRALTEPQYQNAANLYEKDFRPLVAESALTANGQRYAGVWVENVGRSWGSRHDMTWQGYLNWWNWFVDAGYRLVNFERYDTAGGVRYAGIWRQNSDRPGWKPREMVDALVADERDSLDMPGISVAVMQDGEVRYLRGFGHADVDSDEWLDSRHVMRVASVAKGVGGVLTMRLDEQGIVDRDDLVGDTVPGLPGHHTYSIEQVASNRGCVRHYSGSEAADGADPDDVAQWKDEDSTLDSTWYASATAAGPVFWDSDLVCTVGSSNYSTHGYTILGAALEGATGQPVSELLMTQLNTPYGLGTLRAEDMSDTSVRRTTLYDAANDELTPDEVSWKVLGGGMESSAADLAAFGDKLIDEQILTGDSLDAMWSDTGWGYAYGWSIDSEGSQRRIGKNGASDGSTAYLQMYPDAGITVAVLMNRNDGTDDNRAEALGKQIGTLVLNTL